MVRVLNISDAHVHLHYSARRFRQLLVDDLRGKTSVNGATDHQTTSNGTFSTRTNSINSKTTVNGAIDHQTTSNGTSSTQTNCLNGKTSVNGATDHQTTSNGTFSTRTNSINSKTTVNGAIDHQTTSNGTSSTQTNCLNGKTSVNGATDHQTTSNGTFSTRTNSINSKTTVNGAIDHQTTSNGTSSTQTNCLNGKTSVNGATDHQTTSNGTFSTRTSCMNGKTTVNGAGKHQKTSNGTSSTRTSCMNGKTTVNGATDHQKTSNGTSSTRTSSMNGKTTVNGATDHQTTSNGTSSTRTNCMNGMTTINGATDHQTTSNGTFSTQINFMNGKTTVNRAGEHQTISNGTFSTRTNCMNGMTTVNGAGEHQTISNGTFSTRTNCMNGKTTVNGTIDHQTTSIGTFSTRTNCMNGKTIAYGVSDPQTTSNGTSSNWTNCMNAVGASDGTLNSQGNFLNGKTSVKGVSGYQASSQLVNTTSSCTTCPQEDILREKTVVNGITDHLIDDPKKKETVNGYAFHPQDDLRRKTTLDGATSHLIDGHRGKKTANSTSSYISDQIRGNTTTFNVNHPHPPEKIRETLVDGTSSYLLDDLRGNPTVNGTNDQIRIRTTGNDISAHLLDKPRGNMPINGFAAHLVNPGSKAAQRGIREGDVITSINGQQTKSLTNGESHALLRSVEDTLRLGLNQDTNGSPKRRSKEPLKREASSSSTPSTPVPASPLATPGDTQDPSGAQVYVRGIWNSVKKTKQQNKNNERKPEKVNEMCLEETVSKTTASKARRLRKLKLKSARQALQSSKESRSTEIQDIQETEINTEEEKNVNNELIEITIEETVLTAPNVTDGKSHSDNLGSAKVGDGNGIPQSTNDANDLEKTCISKTKNKGKTKGFKLSKIFVTNTEQNSSNNNKSGPETAVACNDADQEIVNAKTRNYVNENATSSGDIEILRAQIDDVSNVAHSETTKSQCLEQTVVDSSDSHINTDLKNSEKIQDINALIKLTSSEFGDKIVNSSKITEATTVLDTSNQTDSSQIDVPSKIEIIDIVEYSSHSEDEFKSQNNKEQKSRPISIFVVPPDNIAQEAESIEIDWESVSDFEGRSLTISSDDDDVRPETLIHLPSNDMESSAALKDGRNGIVQVHDYELSVQDLYSRFMEPEEEARLRTFLETLNLSKPDEYDETSSSRSFGDSSSNTSMSENSPIPQTPADEVVIYRHLKTHSVAESCYIPPKRRHFLDVITEENSDPSDTEKRSGNINPWENPELIRKNNEIESIPNDWYDSDDEPEITSDDGGIDTSWGEGKQLDDVEGVEVVFLNSSSDDEMVLRKTFEEKLDNKQDNKNKAELVIVHIGNTEDVKKLTDVSPCLDSNKITSSKHAMEEIMAILDSTYEINKDLFNNPLVMNATCNETKIIKFDKSTLEDTSKCTSNLGCNHEIKSENKETKRNVMNLDSKYALPERSQTEKLNGETHSTGNQNLEAGFTEFPLPEESSVVFTPPMLSRQNSSSSATSQSTAKFNANQSPLSSEAEDKTDNQINRKIKSKKKVYNPKTLTHLSKEIITNLPHGEFYLQKIGFCNDDITETDVKESSRVTISNEKLTSLPPSGISTRRSSFYELENITHQQSYKTPYTEEDFSPRPVLLQSPPPSTLTSPPLNDDPWLGLPTSADRRLLVCLSPSQCKDNHINNPKEATELLELHKKFVERRGYHESSKRNSTFSPKSDRSHSPGFNSPDLIRLEPYKSNSAQGYTPELLIEAANLLALKEYRQSRLKSGPQSNSFKTPELTSVKINGNVLEKNGGLSEVTSPQTEINGDSEDPDANRSAGTSRLLALLQDGAPCCSPNNTASSEMVRVDKSDDTKAKRVHRYSGSYISEWLKMSENVNSVSEISSKTDINENVIHAKSANESSNESLTLNGFDKSPVEPRQFKADKYKISKKGDIAIMPEENEVKPPKKSDRPKSMPPVGVPALSPSGGEQFREQMYNEYMNKVAERFERRQQKVIKISNRPLSMCGNPETEVEKNAQIAPTNKLESEFLSKVRERMSKLGINLDEDPSGGEGGENADDAEELPKHLQEFMELTSQTPDAPDTGVWSPGTTPEPKRKEFNFTEAQEDSKGEEDPIPPVWTPKSAQASPTSERKFRPVNFESPTPTRKTYNQKSSEDTPKPPTDLPISVESPSHSSSSTSHSQLTSSSASYSHHETSSRLVTSSSLPDTSTLNPTITLLQKAREGQLPRGAHYLDQNSTNITENRSSSSLDKRSSPPSVRSNEVLYSTRREYESESEDKRPKKTVEITPKKYQGIGPTTKDGIPIVLRSEVQDENQHKWYKRMYDSLQRAEKDKEYVTVRYKTRRGRYPYTNSAGYLSEPEPLGGYDSDIASAKYATLDRRRIRNRDNDFTTSTMPRTNKYNAVKHAVDVYKNQPGRIEDYEPGHSSIADKEAKQWWDEVMDIFDGQFEQTQKSSPRTHTPATTGTSKPFMTYALKESGYESDSTLVFKRRDETQQQLSPAEQKQAYKVIQKGGDVPLHGLRKPVPEKPKGPDDSDLEYFPISPHLTRIRIHKNKQVIKPVNEVICYPITSITVDNPPPVFSTYKRSAKTSSNLLSSSESFAARPPSPPKRRSSHNSSTLRLYSKMSISPSPKKARLSRSASSGVEVDSNVQYLKDRISSKLGVGIDSKVNKQKKKDQIISDTKVEKGNRVILRTGSLSPTVKTTVIAAPASETKVTRKTSIERKSSVAPRSRIDQDVTARLAKSTELRSPGEVKKVLKQREVKERSSTSKSLPPGTVVKSSTTLYSSSSRGLRKPKEDKQLKVTVAISAKGRELLSSSVSSSSGLKDDLKLHKKTEADNTSSTITSPSSAAATVASTSVGSQPITSLSPTGSKSPRPLSQSDSDKRPSSRSTGQNSPVARDIKSPVGKITTLPTVVVSPVPSSDPIKKIKKADSSPEVPKKKKDKIGSASVSKSPLLRNGSNKKSTKDNDSDNNGKKKSKKSKDGDSPPSSKKLTKKSSTKKSREKNNVKRISENPSESDPSTGCKDRLAVVPVGQISSSEFPDVNITSMPGKGFFQNLLLRNLPSPTPSNVSTLQRNTSVLERAKKFYRNNEHSSLPYRSEPSLRLINVYLSQKKPVSESKFRSLDREITSNRSSRSQSPLFNRSRRYEFLEKIDKFDRINNVWDRSNGYYSPLEYRSRSPELYKERSSSEPPRTSPTQQNEPQEDIYEGINNAHWDYENMSPTHSRSPSCRRIRSTRSAIKTIESIGGLKRKGVRTKSLSEADSKRSFPQVQTQSTSSLNLAHLTDHHDYQTYVMELLHSTKKSDRFKELHKFYASLERMGELERTTSNTDLRPRKKGEEVIDYDRWKQLRTKERAEEELRNIYEKLKEDQKEKDLLFQPKDSESIKWKGDIGLRSKEKSVEDLRHRFQKMAYEDSDIELCKRKALNATKDTYKPLWRGSSVVNLANTLVHRTKRNRSASEVDQTVSSTHRATSNQVSRSIGSRLWSSLSMEQVNALKNQLSEIYSTVSSLKRDRINRMLQGKSHDRNCEIVIHPKENCRAELPERLQVRCNSLLTKEQLYSPLNQRREAQRKECKKADSISSIPNWKDSRDSSSLSGDSSHSQSSLGKPLSESEKKKLSMTLSQEVKNRVTKRCTDEKKKKRRVSSSIVIPRETMGAVAAIKGSKQTVRTKSPSASDISPRTCYSIEMSEEGSFTKQTSSLIDHDKRDFLLVLTPKDDNLHEVRKVVDNWAESKPQKQDDKVVARLVQTTSNSETDSGSSDASTVIHLGSREDVQKKVNYFEKKTGKDNDLFDGRVSRSVGDMRSFHQEIKHRAKSAPSTFTTDKSKSNLALSQSFSDIKELFGEKRASEYATTQRRKLKHPKTFDICRVKLSERNSQGVDSGLHSSEESLPIRSRSISPDPMKYYRAYLSMVKAGDVRKLRDKFESLDDLYTITDEENLNEPCPPPKRYQSDPDLTREFFARKEPIICKTIVRGQEVGDVKWLKKRYEHNPHRGRSKIPRVVSPVPLKSDNRFMPHINVISKLATLQQQRSQPTPPARPDPCVFRTGEVDRLRHQFEAQQELSLLGQMYTSTPDVRELRDIAPYLECNWVAHQYPKPRSLSSPETQRSPICSPKTRSASSSPIRRQTASILKHQQKKQNVFSNQHFDPSIHRPLYRYQPPSPSVDTSYHYRPWTRDPYWWWRHWWYPSTKPTVTFKEPVRGRVPAAPTPLRSYSAQQRPESPHRYVESEVTIHYRSPVRSEEKEAWPEEELQRRQAEAMRRIYQEERRRKYLQELQDMYSRRHTDNFIPSQKSPIPLNRYDDFVDDSSPGRPRDRTPEPKLVARALYNFVGQSLRELTFRRGDIIYVRRQIDKNWYEGEHNAMIGLFPINYVEIIPYDGIRTVPKRPTEGQARAKFNFQAQTHLELPLVKGELIVLTRRVDNNWFEGRIGTRKGIFPVSYVEVLVEPGERAMSPVRVNTPTKPVASPAAHSLHMGSVMSQHHYTPPRPVSYTSLPRQKATELKQPPVNQTLHIDTQNDPVPYRVLYNYKPQNEDELELVEGETVYVMEKCDDGWYVGSSQRTGYLGTFPGNYVERIV